MGKQMSVPVKEMEAEALAALKRNDGDRALKLFKELAALNYIPAFFCLGNMYMLGEGGVQPNIEEALRCHQRVFESHVRGYSQVAALRLGYMYEAGLSDQGGFGVAVDSEKAFSYYKYLEDSDISIGLWRLGCMFAVGSGTEKDPKKAMELYKRAAKLGHVLALKNMGLLKLQSGNVPVGLLLIFLSIPLWAFFRIFKPQSRHIALV